MNVVPRPAMIAASLLFLVAPGLCQGDLPQCGGEMCRAVRQVLIAAPARFVPVHGTAIPPGEVYGWNAAVILPKFNVDRCMIRPTGDEYRCEHYFPISANSTVSYDRHGPSTATRNEVYEAVSYLLSNWCNKSDRMGPAGPDAGLRTVWWPPAPDCSETSRPVNGPVELEWNRWTPEYFRVALIVRPFSSRELRLATATGTVTIQGAPPGSNVSLDYASKGTTDPNGSLVLTSVKPGKYKLAVTAMARKPFSQEVTVAGDDSQTVVAHLEPAPLSQAEVERGLKEGISPARMKTLVAEVGVDFPLTDASEQRLRAAGADDALIIAIAKNKK